jgi:3-hydroxypropanoate dehydrogenase
MRVCTTSPLPDKLLRNVIGLEVLLPRRKSMKADDSTLELLFRSARTFSKWLDRKISDDTLRQVYELVKLGPTSANCSPARFVFVRTLEGKRRLLPFLSRGNRDKTMAAPVTVIVAYDPKFYDYLPKLFPNTAARAWFANDETLAEETALRNSSLQGAYMIVAARALGMDCGPMSGFDRNNLDMDLLSTWGWKSNFLINFGYGDPSEQRPRLSRLSFEDVCRLT